VWNSEHLLFTRQEHVSISNIVKCRPPRNRTPTPEEVDACIHWLYDQIGNGESKDIDFTGNYCIKYIAGPEYKITRDHVKWFQCQGSLTVAVYHPAELLRILNSSMMHGKN